MLALGHTAAKLSKYRVFSGSYFPVFGLNARIYGVNVRTQSKYGKMRIKKKLPIWALFTQCHQC